MSPLPDPAAEGSALPPPLKDAMPIKDRILMKDEAPIKEEIPVKDRIPIKDEGGEPCWPGDGVWGGFGGVLVPLKQVMKFLTLVSSRKSCGKVGKSLKTPKPLASSASVQDPFGIHPGICLGSVLSPFWGFAWELSGIHPGSVWGLPGICPGFVWDLPRVCLGSIWDLSGIHPEPI